MPNAPPDTTVQPCSASPYAELGRHVHAVRGRRPRPDHRDRSVRNISPRPAAAAHPEAQRWPDVLVDPARRRPAPGRPGRRPGPATRRRTAPRSGRRAARARRSAASASRRGSAAGHLRPAPRSRKAAFGTSPRQQPVQRRRRAVGLHQRPDRPVARLGERGERDPRGAILVATVVTRSWTSPIRSWIASSTSARPGRSRPSRSAMVQASRRTRSKPRADSSPRSSAERSPAVSAAGSCHGVRRRCGPGTSALTRHPPAATSGPPRPSGPEPPGLPPRPTARPAAVRGDQLGGAQRLERDPDVDPVEQRTGQPGQVAAADDGRQVQY